MISQTALKHIIADSLSFNIFCSDDCFRIGKDKRHISLELLDAPKHLKETTLKLLQYHLRRSGSKSVISAAGNDPYLKTLAFQAGSGENMTCYDYTPDDRRTLGPPIEPARVPCTLVIPYALNQSHVLGMVNTLSQQKVPVSQVIAVIDENLSGTELPDQDFELTFVSDFKSLREQIRRFCNATPEKIEQALSKLT